MTRSEFAEVIGFLELSTGKPIHEDEDQALARTKLYFQMLGDLPLDVLRSACERLVCERKWPSFPQIAEIREFAALVRDSGLTPGEAWRLARQIASRYDPDQESEWGYVVNGRKYDSHWQAVTDGAPPLVVKAMKQFGIPALCYGGENRGVQRGQFMKIYEQTAEQERREVALPAPLRKQNGLGRVQELLGRIGQDANG